MNATWVVPSPLFQGDSCQRSMRCSGHNYYFLSLALLLQPVRKPASVWPQPKVNNKAQTLLRCVPLKTFIMLSMERYPKESAPMRLHISSALHLCPINSFVVVPFQTRVITNKQVQFGDP